MPLRLQDALSRVSGADAVLGQADAHARVGFPSCAPRARSRACRPPSSGAVCAERAGAEVGAGTEREAGTGTSTAR